MSAAHEAQFFLSRIQLTNDLTVNKQKFALFHVEAGPTRLSRAVIERLSGNFDTKLARYQVQKKLQTHAS